ncbi:MAG: hypothetical protein D4R63_06660 [Methylococcaceae bacterium]|nr:MAG: hypothetical protein D4R63_06660 [Methylococcaceae bacterium]
MTGMLASVNSLAEAKIVLAAKVDIIDLKQPAQGALGALPYAEIAQIIAHCQAHCPISATIGDLPLEPELISNAVLSLVQLKVNYIKIGLFPTGDLLATVAALQSVDLADSKLIAVIFADLPFQLEWLSVLKQANFSGVMLDTMNKQQGGLTHLLSAHAIAEFVQTARQQDLLCGLAGSLRLSDIAELRVHQADYLGFRGALCVQHERVGQLDLAAINSIYHAVRARPSL